MHYFVKLEITRSDFRQPELAMRKLRLLNYTLHYTPQKNIANPLILFGYFQPNDGVNLQVPGSSPGRGARIQKPADESLRAFSFLAALNQALASSLRR